MDKLNENLVDASTVTYRFSVKHALAENDVAILKAVLLEIPGILDSDIEAGQSRLSIRYDATRIDADRLAGVLEETGISPADGWFSRLRRSWRQYQDSNIRESSGTQGGSCCSRPTDVYASRHRR